MLFRGAGNCARSPTGPAVADEPAPPSYQAAEAKATGGSSSISKARGKGACPASRNQRTLRCRRSARAARTGPGDIVYYNSVGLGVQDAAAAWAVIRAAREADR